MDAPVLKTFKVFGLILYGIVLVGLMTFGLAYLGPGIGFFGFFFLMFFLVWAIYAYLRYREGRQAEVHQLILSTVEGGMPLAPALYAYLRDRPERSEYWAIVGWFVFSVLLPFLPLWAWLRVRRFDRRVRQFAEQITIGASLSAALRAVPDVAARETRLAVVVGEASGSLPACLRRADRERVGAAWLEVLPRLFYPFLLLLFVMGITTFLLTSIMPKYSRIFEEFGMKFPPITQLLREVANYIEDWMELIGLAQLGVIILISAVIASPTLRWHLPLLGRLYRWDAQGQVLRALGQLIGAKKTVPQSLHMLAEADELPEVIQKRLKRAAATVERGEPLANSMRQAGLLPRAMVPLVQAAERTGTLSMALGELGDHLGGKAFRVVRRISLV